MKFSSIFVPNDADENESTKIIKIIHSTGGGWQDQVGGLALGIKMVTSQPGLNQQLVCIPANVSLTTFADSGVRIYDCKILG